MPAHRSASSRLARSGGLTRRRALTLAGGAAAALPLPACGSGAPDNDGAGGKTFRIYWNPGHDYTPYQKVIDVFEKEHGVTVQMQKYQWPDMRTRILTDFQSGNVPDLMEEPGGWVQEFALSGDALSLQKYIERDGQEMGFPGDWQSAAVEHNAHDGEVYGIQLHQTCSLLLYNKQMFDKAGVEPPTTWGEVVDVCKELTGGGVHGISLNQDKSYAWPWMLQNSVREYDPKTKKLLMPRDAVAEAQMSNVGWLNSYQALILPFVMDGFGIFLMRQFIQPIPDDLLDAGRVDGGSEFAVYRRIVLPQVKPALAVLGLFTFVFQWNEFLWPLVATTTEDMRTIPVGLTLFNQEHFTLWHLTAAGSVIMFVPTALILIFAQRYFVRGIVLTGLK